MDYWEIEEVSEAEFQRRGKGLANCLGSQPGTRETKIRWCQENVSLLELEAEATGKTGRALSAEIRRLAIRWWRHHFNRQSADWRDKEVFLQRREAWKVDNPWFRNESLDPGLARTALAERAFSEVQASGIRGHFDGFFEKVTIRLEELESEGPSLRAVGE